MESKLNANSKIILKVTLITLIANIVLTVLKIVFGLIFGNLAVISDAIHSMTDVATSLLVIIGVFISSPKRDKKFNYGREKTESLIVLFFSVVLIGTGCFLFWKGIEGIINPVSSTVSFYLLGVTIVSIISKEGMFWYTRHYGKKVNSQMLIADAWHHRSDSLSSIAVLIGLVVGIFTKNNLAESIAILFVALLIIKVAFDILRPAINQLLEKSANEKTSNKIIEITNSIDGVKSIDTLRTRIFGNKIYVDIEISVDKNLTVEQSHDIAQTVHDVLEATEELSIKHCMVHVNPFLNAENDFKIDM